MSENIYNINDFSFEQAYNRLKEIYSIINNKDIIDISRLDKLQQEADKLYEYLQGFINKEENKG